MHTDFILQILKWCKSLANTDIYISPPQKDNFFSRIKKLYLECMYKYNIYNGAWLDNRYDSVEKSNDRHIWIKTINWD